MLAPARSPTSAPTRVKAVPSGAPVLPTMENGAPASIRFRSPRLMEDAPRARKRSATAGSRPALVIPRWPLTTTIVSLRFRKLSVIDVSTRTPSALLGAVPELSRAWVRASRTARRRFCRSDAAGMPSPLTMMEAAGLSESVSIGTPRTGSPAFGDNSCNPPVPGVFGSGVGLSGPVDPDDPVSAGAPSDDPAPGRSKGNVGSSAPATPALWRVATATAETSNTVPALNRVLLLRRENNSMAPFTQAGMAAAIPASQPRGRMHIFATWRTRNCVDDDGK